MKPGSALMRRGIGKLGKPVQRRLIQFLEDRVAVLDDPRIISEALSGAKLGN